MTHTYTCALHSQLRLCADNFNDIAKRHHDLQASVLSALPPNQDILHVKSMADWCDVLMSPRNHTITMNTDTVIAAQSLVIHPTLTDTVAAADMLDMELPGEPHTVSTFCAVMTHPAHRGRHLMQRMMDEWKYVARQDGRSHLLGCITRSNVPSWSQFLNAGLVITGAGFDTSDDSTVYYAHCDMRDPVKFDMSDCVTVPDDHPMDDLQELFTDGYVGVGGKKQDGQYTRGLVMARRL